MRRYWLSLESFSENEVCITGEFFQHICKVCRQEMGSRFEVLNENDKAYFVEIIHIGKKEALAKILEQRDLPTPSKPQIHLALSLPKFQTLENVIEKSVELGVDSLHVFSSDYSFAKSGKKDLNKKAERWQRIIKGASQQTGRGKLMKLTFGTPLCVLLQDYGERNACALLAYEGEGIGSIKQALAGISGGVDEVWLFVGSEGGFSQEDLSLFNDYNILPLTLGDQVLRVETACVTLVSILKYGLGQFD